MRRTRLLALGLLAIGATAGGHPGSAQAQGGSVVNFETIPTRAVALSPDGSRLFVTNVPDSRLEIFSVTATGLSRLASVPVGLEPVAVNARTNSEVWVVNNVSDSVSVVDVAATPPRVVRTILVGDEPRDVVFAGPNNSRAFVTAARRGQNHPADTVGELQVEGVGRADVWVFDANNLGEGLAANRLGIIQLFGDKPGSMGVSPDGSRVFVALATSGNETTAINDEAMCGITNNGAIQAGNGQFSEQNSGGAAGCMTPNGGISEGGTPGPNRNNAGNVRNPRTGLIAKFNRQSGQWLDILGRDWSHAVPFTLPDTDVFVIDANANPPRQISSFAHVGTLNFSVAPHPTNGRTYVATIEAINLNRFISVPGGDLVPNPNRIGNAARTADPITGKTLRGHLYESRIAILSPGGGVTTRHLNKHINYEIDGPTPTSVRDRSVANPQGLAFSADGSTLFVAALGSNKIVPFQTAQLDNDSFVPNASTHIQLSGDGGPSDMVFDRTGSRMFVYRRFDNAVSIVDVAARRETASVGLYNPESAAIRVGRKFFYDARLTSSNGEANCNVCHPAADKDDLPWDLGTPFGGLEPNPNQFVNGFVDFLGLFGVNPTREFNPLKGPMTPLTLRGIKDSGPMFWRGDITNPQDPLNERINFSRGFGIVFQALNGLDNPLPQPNIDQLTDWALSIIPPPNPHRTLNQVLTASQARGMDIYLNGSPNGMGGRVNTDVIFNCVTCHALNPGMGFYGTQGRNTIEGETQFFKVTQLRTVYDKVGMFGHTMGDNGDARTNGGPRVNVGPQIRASGTLHDGSAASPEEFLTAGVFQLNTQQLFDVVNFTFAFPSNFAPVVGQQVTLRAGSGADVNARIELLKQRAGTSFVLPGPQTMTECNLVARATVNGQQRGFLFQPATNNFLDSTGTTVTEAQLRSLVPVTFTCAFPGGGRRLAIDRDQDNVLDGNDPMLNAAPNGGAAPPVDAPAPPVGLDALFQLIAALQALAALAGF